MKSYKIKSYAKVNLYLEVLGKRKDRYHQLLTLFERISLCDEILIKPRPDKIIRIICDHPQVPKGDSNIALRAARMLKKDFPMVKGADIKIKKRIPVASGLAGGSSNAASVLLSLNKLWKLNLSNKKLISYGKALGADVPFFLNQVSFAIGKGRGDEITPLKAIKNKFWHILAVPRVKISTRTVYNTLDKDINAGKRGVVGELTKPRRDVKILVRQLEKGRVDLAGKYLFNRLEDVTLKFYQSVNNLKNKLLGLSQTTILMSGSGPAMFAIAASRKEANKIRSRLSNIGRFDSFVVKTA